MPAVDATRRRRTTLGPINTGGGRRVSMGPSSSSSGVDVSKTNKNQNPPSKPSRKSMIPTMNSTMAATSNNNSTKTSNKGNNRRQSIAVMPQHTARESTARNSTSLAPRASVMMTEDPRPINDKAYMKRSTSMVYKFLMENGYEHPITMKSLHLPSAKDFNQIVTFLLRRFDPSFNDSSGSQSSYSSSNYSSTSLKFEDEVTMAFKALGYPFTISKTGLVAAGSPHTWPALLAALTWLVELLQYDEVREQELEMKKMERANGISDGASTAEKEGVDMEKMIVKSEKAFFDYLLDAYEMFLCGDDERHDELEERLVEMFEMDNAVLEQEKNQIMDNTVSMLEAIEALRTKGDE